MDPLAWHLMLRLADDRVIAREASDLRLGARAVLAIGRTSGLLSFGFADTHLHVLLTCDRSTAGRFAQRLGISLRRRLTLGAPFVPTRFRPIEGQHHLRNAFIYVLRQDTRHEIGRDPFCDGTALPDLLGARWLDPTLSGRVRAWLPRLRRAQLLELMPLGEARAATDPVPPGPLLADAAAAAIGLPDLRGKRPDVVAARCAALHLARERLPAGEARALLGIGKATCTRLSRRPSDPGLSRAIRLQLELRAGHVPAPVAR
jgi:hypothetical protein